VTRIAVTGLGAISALGTSVQDNWQAVADGRGGIARRLVGDSPHGPGALELPMAQVAEGYEAALDAALGHPVAAGLDPFARFALAPALEALEQSGLRAMRCWTSAQRLSSDTAWVAWRRLRPATSGSSA